MPTLAVVFLQTLEHALRVDKKNVPFDICLRTFEQVASETYPERADNPGVKAYVNALYGKCYTRHRFGK